MAYSVNQLNTAFLMSQQKVSKRLSAKKMIASNAYYGKVPDGETWPLESGVSIVEQQLGRIGVPNDAGWRPMSDSLCSTNMCGFEPEVISHGNNQFSYSVVGRDLRTDWICLDSLATRANPKREIQQIEEGLQTITRYVHEEFRRSRYIYFSRNKIVPILDEDPDNEGSPLTEQNACEEGANVVHNGFLFEVRDNGEMDESNVRVCCDPDDLVRVGTLSMDLLDIAGGALYYENAIYNEQRLHDVVLCDRNISNRLALQEAATMGTADVSGGFNMMDLRQTLGTDRVIRDYSMRTDPCSMRFYPDDAFNATLEAFDENDPSTWSRLKRVYPYYPVRAQLAGIEYKVNPAFLRAPFGISVIFTPRVISVMPYPDWAGTGSAKKGEMTGFDGMAKWMNPPWESNINQDKGFWKMRFRNAARPEWPDEGYSFLHRIDRRIKLNAVACPLPSAPCFIDVTPYCHENAGGTTEADGGPNLAVSLTDDG